MLLSFQIQSIAMSRSILFNAITPSLGAEIRGIDINQLDEMDFEIIRNAWLRHKVVFIHNQYLDLENLCRFSERFGDLMQLPYINPLEGFPNVIRVLKKANEINIGLFGDEWHSDFSFLENPPKASMLYTEAIPPLGGDTLWVNMAQAWRDLPDDLRHLIADKTAIHSGTPYFVKHALGDSTQFGIAGTL